MAGAWPVGLARGTENPLSYKFCSQINEQRAYDNIYYIFNKYIIKNGVSYTEPCVSGGHSHRDFSGFLQGGTRVREETTVLLISAFWLNVLWTEISTKWTHCATPNHHIPRYSPQIISSICSVPFWGRSAEPREGNILGLCVYLGHFYCRELF